MKEKEEIETRGGIGSFQPRYKSFFPFAKLHRELSKRKKEGTFFSIPLDAKNNFKTLKIGSGLVYVV